MRMLKYNIIYSSTYIQACNVAWPPGHPPLPSSPPSTFRHARGRRGQREDGGDRGEGGGDGKGWQEGGGGSKRWWGQGEGGGGGERVAGATRGRWGWREGVGMARGRQGQRERGGDGERAAGGGEREVGPAQGWWGQQEGGGDGKRGGGWQEGGGVAKRVVGLARGGGDSERVMAMVRGRWQVAGGWWGRREAVGRQEGGGAGKRVGPNFARAGGDVGCTDIGSPCVAFIHGGARKFCRVPSRPGWRCSVVHHCRGAWMSQHAAAWLMRSPRRMGDLLKVPWRGCGPPGAFRWLWSMLGAWTYRGRLGWQQERAGVMWNVTHSDAIINDGILAVCCCVVLHGDTIIGDGSKQVLASSVLT
ncbi:hypothetical protein K439DRAFT_1615678 [Ramaria rubella]|nr:hypothetical protein K439DRAFT_1615678 [Ramaria rubella]